MIFVDSSYFIAIADKKDQWHERAKELCENAYNELLVTDLILSESVTAVGARGGGKAGVALYDYIFDNCEVLFVTKDMFEKARDIFLKYDGTLSVTDTTSILAMDSRNIKSILSFDSDFDKVKGITGLHEQNIFQFYDPLCSNLSLLEPSDGFLARSFGNANEAGRPQF